MNEVFAKDTIQNLITIEDAYRVDPYYLDNASEIKWEMRARLIDWIYEVASEFSFKISTCHIATSCIDRYS